MQEDIRTILIDRYTIQARVYTLAQQISHDYQVGGAKEFLLMPLLTGSIIFLADLVRHLPVRMKIDVLAVTSYPGRATTPQVPRVLYPTTFDPSLRGRHVMVVDDILDSGRTLQTVTSLLRDQGAASVKTCVLLKKILASPPAITADYTGFEIPDEFVVGYGLDYNGYYRNLPDIAVLHPHVFSAPA
jgi:hypoxanthine phosphoribosyltransferase